MLNRTSTRKPPAANCALEHSWPHFWQAEPVAHHKRKRPKHRRSGCLLCKPQKLTAKAKAERQRSRRQWVRLEKTAW
jgi:hypothetical protein